MHPRSGRRPGARTGPPPDTRGAACTGSTSLSTPRRWPETDYIYILRLGQRVLGAFTSLTQLAKAVNQKDTWAAPTCEVWNSTTKGFDSYPMTRKGLTDALVRTFDSGYLEGQTYCRQGVIEAVCTETGNDLYITVDPTYTNGRIYTDPS